MKQKVWILVAVFLGILLFFGLKPSGTKWVAAKSNQKQILAELPEIIFSEEERTALEDLINLPEMDQYGGFDQLEDLSAAMLEPFLKSLRAEDATESHAMYRVMPEEELTVSFLFHGEKQIVLSLQEDGTFLKVIALYDGQKDGAIRSTACYENRNGVIQKLVPKKQWFF